MNFEWTKTNVLNASNDNYSFNLVEASNVLTVTVESLNTDRDPKVVTFSVEEVKADNLAEKYAYAKAYRGKGIEALTKLSTVELKLVRRFLLGSKAEVTEGELRAWFDDIVKPAMLTKSKEVAELLTLGFHALKSSYMNAKGDIMTTHGIDAMSLVLTASEISNANSELAKEVENLKAKQPTVNKPKTKK